MGTRGFLTLKLTLIAAVVAGLAAAQAAPGPAPAGATGPPAPGLVAPAPGARAFRSGSADTAGPGRPGLKLVPPPRGGIYHSAYPDFRDSEDHVSVGRIRRFEHLAGRDIAWTYFSNNWGRRIRFPLRSVRRIHRAGSIPFVRLMARSRFREGAADPRYRLQRIIDGDFDGELLNWGRAAARWGRPMLVEFGTEANGSWFPWNGTWNGGARTTGFGHPALPDGPERFRAAYRHVRDTIEAGGAGNLTWFFHADDQSVPARSWNSIRSYYPGDRYVDWIGVSVYGPLVPGDPWRPGFIESMRRVYPKLASLSAKPIALLEFGARQGRRKSAWFRRALKSVAGHRFPRVRAMSVWNEAWPNHDGTRSRLQIDSDRRTLRTYRRLVARPVFTARPRFRPR